MPAAPRQSRVDTVLLQVRQEVLERAFLLTAIFGAVAIAATSVRNLTTGGSWLSMLPSFAVYALVAALHAWRGRVPPHLRGAAIVSGLCVVTCWSIVNSGAYTSAEMLLPTAFLIGWLSLGERFLAPLAVFLLSCYGMAIWRVVEHGPLTPHPPDADRLVSYWIALAATHVFAGLLVVGTFRSLIAVLLRRNAKAQESRDRYMSIVEGLRDPVFIHDRATRRVEERNRASWEVFGDAPMDSHRWPWSLEDVTSRFDAAVEAGCGRILCLARRGEGGEFWIEAAIRVFRVYDAEKVAVSIRDVDDKIRHHLRMEEANRELDRTVETRTASLEASRKALEDFTSGLADRLRTPAKTIRMLAEELGRGWEDDSERAHFRNRIRAGGARMEELIDALLGLSRIDHAAFLPESVNMAEIAEDCCLELVAAGWNVAWSVEALPPCETDTALARQIWANLLSNAFKYSAGREGARVGVSCHARKDGIWYVVSDNGPGFDPGQAGKLFTVFQRLHTGSVEGLGIGLATVRRILNRLDGTIEAESRPGQGAEFRFRLGNTSAAHQDDAATSWEDPSVSDAPIGTAR